MKGGDQTDSDFLSEAQWEWLDKTLAASTARVHLFVSSLPLLEQVVRGLGENWDRFPAAKERFLMWMLAQNPQVSVY